MRWTIRVITSSDDFFRISGVAVSTKLLSVVGTTQEYCSQYGWCDTSAAYCDLKTCLKAFSGKGSFCASGTSSTLKTSAEATATPSSFASSIPVIDVCGHALGGVSCPGAGLDGYFYRCCSSAGHCGPKNDIQDQTLYCGTGCQAGYGKCDNEKKPVASTGIPGTAGEVGYAVREATYVVKE
ncbi:hypothetical protein N0V90_005488 [Kalmusia sp. IMI 367209]|nr:hypothetical protein N0V90_005488 [Kalmusia sp. IMI 367209]